MLSQNLLKIVPFAMLVAATSGCDGSGDTEFDDVNTEAAWVTGHDGYVGGLFAEPGRGDVVIVDDTGLSRLDADGARLFRHVGEILLQDVAFTPEGNTLLVSACFQPVTFAGETLCEELDPQIGTQAMMLLELDRAGAVVQSATFPATGIGSINSQALAVDDDGNVHISGMFSGTVDFGDDSLETDTQSIFYLQLDTKWQPKLARNFGASSGSVGAIATDPASGDAFIVGTFSGPARFSGINLTNGPNGQAIFLVRLSRDAEPRWAKHFLGSGQFEARFDDDGGLYVYGRGYAPFTSLGGDHVIDGPFATKLDGDGEHQWTWRAHDSNSGSGATVDSTGRIVALYTEATLIKPAVEPSEDCYYDYWGPECEYQPAEYRYRRIVDVVAPDGTELGGLQLSSNEYGSGQGRVAAGPDGTVYVAEGASGQDGVNFGTGMRYDNTVLAKLRLSPQP